MVQHCIHRGLINKNLQENTIKAFKHSFTHYNLWINPILVDSPGEYENYFQKSSNLKALPAPVKKIIQAL